MTIRLRPAGEAAVTALGERARFDPTLSLVDPDAHRHWLHEASSTLPDTALDLDVPVVGVSSYRRRSFLRKPPTELVVVDDELRRRTFQVIEEFVHTRDRPLIPWMYLALVFGELTAASGATRSDMMVETLTDVVDTGAGPHLNDLGFIERSPLLMRTIKLATEGPAPTDVLLERAAYLYPLFHEIGHLLSLERPDVAGPCRELIARSIGDRHGSGKLRDYWSIHWSDPSTHDANPRYGPLRVADDERDDVNGLLREHLTEELFCDWFATTLLLTSPAFAELEPDDLVALVVRQLSHNQLLADATAEVPQLGSGRKRFRPLLFDAHSVRQQQLVRLLEHTELTQAVFGTETGRIFEDRLSRLSGDLDEVIDVAVMRRHYVRFLCLHYPCPEDHRWTPETVPLKAKIDDSRREPDVVLSQPAEWGIGDTERFTAEFELFAETGRLHWPIAGADQVEELMPYVSEGYHLLNWLRRSVWTRRIEEAESGESEPVPPIDESLERLHGYQAVGRQSMIQWFGRDDNHIRTLFALCYRCHAGVPVDLAAMQDAVDVDAPLSEPLPVACPHCRNSPMAHSLMWPTELHPEAERLLRGR